MRCVRIRRTSTILLAALLIGAVPLRATAEETHDKGLGSQPGLAAPHADSKGRAGTWWWPRTNGEVAKGNQGRVFGRRDATREVKAEMEPPLPPVPIEQPFNTCGRRYLLNNLLFSGDSALLKPEVKAECDKLARDFQKDTLTTVVLIGHTDDTGPAEYNLKLGERRAQAAKDYLVSSGVAPERIGIRSMGETQPAVPNDSPQNRALNRRVVFEIKLGN